LNCDLCDSTNVPNCLQCDPDDPLTCLSCNQDFYLDKLNQQCVECSPELGLTQDQGCFRCSGTDCVECLKGYYK